MMRLLPITGLVVCGQLLAMAASAGAGPAEEANLEKEFTTAAIFGRGQDGYHTFRIPSLLTTPAGTLLAICEGRKNSGRDYGDIDLVMKRSADNGKTWTSLQLISSDSTNTIGNPCPVVDQSTGVIWLPFCRNNDQVFVTSSADGGTNWSTPVEITARVKKPGWGWYATGPGVGIQLAKGPDRGRLLIPCDNSQRGGDKKKHSHSHMIYSDDHGATWELGGLIGPQMNECQAVELADGTLMMNMRNADSSQDCRAIATSADGGATWSDISHDPTLIEPICQASFLRYTLKANDGKNRLLFSNPASVSKRIAMTVRLSYDEGRTWPVARLLHGGPTAYSCLAVLPDKTIGCLYEAGKTNSYETITFARFSLAWLTRGADRGSRSKAVFEGSGTEANKALSLGLGCQGTETAQCEHLRINPRQGLPVCSQTVHYDFPLLFVFERRLGQAEVAGLALGAAQKQKGNFRVDPRVYKQVTPDGVFGFLIGPDISVRLISSSPKNL